MKYFFLYLFLWVVTPCPGQNIDSLKKIAFHQKKLSIQKGLLLAGIGNTYFAKHSYDSSARYFDKAAIVLTPFSKQDTLTGNYTNLANAYIGLKNYNKAIAMYNQVISVAPKTGPRRVLLAAFKQMGALYESKHNYREALSYFRQSFDISDSLDFAEKTRENTSEAYSHNFMTDVMGSIKHKTESEEDILKTIDTKKSLNDTLAVTINYFNLGQLYKSKKMYPQALDALETCLNFATAINYTDMQTSAVNEIADLYERTGNYKQSLIYFKKRGVISALNKAGKSKTIDELQTKYEITQREDQLLQQQFEITKRNYWVTGTFIIVLLMLLIGFIYYKQTQLRQRNIAMKAIIETEESERRRIAQDLHDSVSQTMSAAKINLAVIGAELPFVNDDQKRRFEKAITMVDDGFKEVRTISHNMMPWALNETGLAQVVKQFLGNIETDTMAVNFFSKGFDAPFDDTTEIILYRVLQESVHNVMKHAHANRLDIALIKDEENISLTIEDNGKGFDATNPAIYNGMGLNNLRSRINFLKGKVEFDSQVGKGTLVSVYVPFAKKGL
ncbi:ATP-binding protein [Mucilaginibacter flavus]|uniref:ATP-binding protein n=1 Tax=Mucilaginibacter flavus TaxID=931504 RepID=UPI0025B484B7|nr:tetratricopeptide repeat protein [Mucilaginibacter flavus]MDN3582354.1 tetratricopeptide repeat protein [Mucilaginibacter flavus]